MLMSDEIGSPIWFNYLSVRSTNGLFSALGKDRCKNYYRNKIHDHINIDFDKHTDETIRPVIKELIEKKLIYLKRMNNIGKKAIIEIHEWCGYKKE